MKRCPRNERFADGSVCATDGGGGCLPVRGSERMAWKYDDDCCGCGQVETEEHVLFECNRYREERVGWRGVMNLVPTISAYTRWNCLATVYNYRCQQIEINTYPDSPLFISTGFLPRVSSMRLN